MGTNIEEIKAAQQVLDTVIENWFNLLSKNAKDSLGVNDKANLRIMLVAALVTGAED